MTFQSVYLVSRRGQIFEHNFAEVKEKSRRNTVVLQGFLTQRSAKFAEKMLVGDTKQALRTH